MRCTCTAVGQYEVACCGGRTCLKSMGFFCWFCTIQFALFFRWIGFESHSFSLTCAYSQRDFPAQDTMHALLSLNFVSLSFIVVPVNLNGSRRLNCLMHTMKLSKQIAIHHAYAEWDKYQADLKCNLTNMNLLEFGTKYKLVSGKLVTQNKNLIPRVFHTYSPTTTSTFLACIVNIN